MAESPVTKSKLSPLEWGLDWWSVLLALPRRRW